MPEGQGRLFGRIFRRPPKEALMIPEGFGVFTEAKNKPNEDAYFILPQQKASGVFDGAGKYIGGAKAANEAKKTSEQGLTSFPQPTSLEEVQSNLKQTLLAAHERVKVNATGRNKNMQTTGIIEQQWDGPDGKKYVVFAWVGDSAGYIARTTGEFHKITSDDSIFNKLFPNHPSSQIIEDQLDNAESLTDLPQGNFFLTERDKFNVMDENGNIRVEERNILKGRDLFANRSNVTQFLGGEIDEIHLAFAEVQKGDRVVLMSDGVKDNLTTKKMGELAREHRGVQQFAEASGRAAVAKSKEPRSATNIRPDFDDATLVARVVS